MLVAMALSSAARAAAQSPGPPGVTNAEQEILHLSRMKWRWMAERNVDTLAALFHEEAVFVHMGGTMSREQELNVIRSGGIHYKHAEIQEVSVSIIGTTVLLQLKRDTCMLHYRSREESRHEQAIPSSPIHSRTEGRDSPSSPPGQGAGVRSM